MAKKPQKEVVEGIVKNLVDSEISGIQSLAKDMMERIKQLEEHSVRIKKYADEIEKLALEASSEKYDKSSLDDLIKNLEKTLTKLRKKQSNKGEISPAVSRPVIPVPDEKQEPEEEVEVTEETAEPASKLRQQLYTTPEGFVVRKTRN
jgi:predicted  nucleic acid-binding Zn-ribbon protein